MAAATDRGCGGGARPRHDAIEAGEAAGGLKMPLSQGQSFINPMLDRS